MAMPVPQKIVLKSATSLTLNDRFSRISAIRPPSAQQTITVQQTRSSLNNQRLSQRLANQNITSSMDKLPVSSRLGNPSVKARLGYKRGTMPLRSVLQRRRGMLYSIPYGLRQRRNQIGPQTSNRGFAYNSFRGALRGLSRGTFRGARNTRGFVNTNYKGFNNNYNNLTSASINYNSNVGQRVFNNSSIRRGRGRGRAAMRGNRGGRIITNKPSATREQLDTELEEYMATSQ